MLSGDELLPNENMMFEKFLSKFSRCIEEVWKHIITPVNFQLR